MDFILMSLAVTTPWLLLSYFQLFVILVLVEDKWENLNNQWRIPSSCFFPTVSVGVVFCLRQTWICCVNALKTTLEFFFLFIALAGSCCISVTFSSWLKARVFILRLPVLALKHFQIWGGALTAGIVLEVNVFLLLLVVGKSSVLVYFPLIWSYVEIHFNRSFQKLVESSRKMSLKQILLLCEWVCRILHLRCFLQRQEIPMVCWGQMGVGWACSLIPAWTYGVGSQPSRRRGLSGTCRALLWPYAGLIWDIPLRKNHQPSPGVLPGLRSAWARWLRLNLPIFPKGRWFNPLRDGLWQASAPSTGLWTVWVSSTAGRGAGDTAPAAHFSLPPRPHIPCQVQKPSSGRGATASSGNCGAEKKSGLRGAWRLPGGAGEFQAPSLISDYMRLGLLGLSAQQRGRSRGAKEREGLGCVHGRGRRERGAGMGGRPKGPPWAVGLLVWLCPCVPNAGSWKPGI